MPIPPYSYTNAVRMCLPRIDDKRTIIRNIFDSNLGKGIEINYENLIDTGFYSLISENYITINTLSDRQPYSRFKIKTFDVTGI